VDKGLVIKVEFTELRPSLPIVEADVGDHVALVIWVVGG
jgi:hypothetical protein